MDSIIRLGTFCIRDRSSEKATAVVSPPSGVPVVLKRTLTRPHRYILFSADIALWSMYATRAANSKQHCPGQVWRVYSQQTSEGRFGSQYHTEGTDQTIFCHDISSSGFFCWSLSALRVGWSSENRSCPKFADVCMPIDTIMDETDTASPQIAQCVML